jgi:hypothetical protein
MLNNKRRQAAQQAAEAHRANLLKALRHRLEIARANGDERLVRQLEEEASYLK